MKIIWSPLALDRIDEIAAYIAQDNVSAALTWVDAVFARVKRLAAFPESGRAVPELNRVDIREIIHGEYRVIYRIRRSHVAILTVRHGRQELPKDEPA